MDFVDGTCEGRLHRSLFFIFILPTNHNSPQNDPKKVRRNRKPLDFMLLMFRYSEY